MRITKLMFMALLLAIAGSVLAKAPDRPGKSGKHDNKVHLRGECANSESQIDQEINNVRARLLGGGDCWWDLNDGSYYVPKVDPASGQKPVSSIFAGSVWLGGIDPGGNLKLACQDYRNDGRNDFWPGPLNDQGLTDESICKNWDRHFRVTGEEIREHLKNVLTGNLNPELIPRGVKGWPAKGNNVLFAEVWGFDLPVTTQGLAGFYDADFDGLYNPLKGDYPSIEIKGCEEDRYPDEMIFWIYNDEGGGAPHARTNGDAIQMEVQVQAFGYTTNDELNDMTFQRYKLINRATERIDSCFFAMWSDPDLGCSEDDYIGCDTSKDLMYIYNQDPLDGISGCACNDLPATYCDKVPILGIDYFRGPLDTFFRELGMSSFTYYNRAGLGGWPTGMGDPGQDVEYYNYITGSWRDGTPFTYGGSGYAPNDPTAIPTKYVFTEAPNDANGWSMCTANLGIGDRRTLQATGPFSLKPGAVNELIIGVPWVPDIEYPCPDVEQLFRADKLAQGLFDNCFELLDGPDAPNVDWVELDRQVVAVLTNDSISNNFGETYEQEDFLAPDSLKDKPAAQYRFEGYLIYQLANPNISAKDYSNQEFSRLVYQVDAKNSIATVYNWLEKEGPVKGESYYSPELQVQGANGGIRHTFPIAEDKFAKTDDKRLINHRKYYFAVVAYAHNEFAAFDPKASPVTGQQRPFLIGRRNIQNFTVIPRPIVDFELNAFYGEGVEITRLEGAGAGGNFLDLSDETRTALANGNLPDSALTYRDGRGPISIAIFNPFEVRDGEYELSIVDGNLTDNKIDADARWELKSLADGAVVASERSIAQLNEQIVKKYGFSVTVAQTTDAGAVTDDQNGAIGIEIEYADVNQQWLTSQDDADFGFFDFLQTEGLKDDAQYDKSLGLSRMGGFYPYALANWRLGNPAEDPWYITPAWTERGATTQGILNGSVVEVGNPGKRRAKLAGLPNVDIVMTADRSKWSRCVVAEGASYLFTSGQYQEDPELVTESPSNKKRLMFDTRYSPSVGKDDADGDGRPDPDGSVDANGNPIFGMGWFPGYAVDVESGRRLNIFFTENSVFSAALNPAYTGRDMMFNPTSNVLSDRPIQFQPQPYNFEMGGYHTIYVMNTQYDSCAELYKKLTPDGTNSPSAKVSQLRNIGWCGMVRTQLGYQMKSYRDGLIPNETRVKLRVDNPYQTWYNENDPNPDPKKRWTGHPKYRFKINGREKQALDIVQMENALDSVKVSPNPYYGYSQYETSQYTNIVKITNLPAKCTVTIFSIDGKFIRKYERNEIYSAYNQIAPDVEWDLKNSKSIPVASGVYLININAPNMGERTIKWFGIARQYDATGQ